MQWTPECQQAIDILKTLLCSAPVQSTPTEDGCFYLDTDASEVAIAAILQEEQEKNGSKKLRVIAYEQDNEQRRDEVWSPKGGDVGSGKLPRKFLLTSGRTTVYP